MDRCNKLIILLVLMYVLIPQKISYAYENTSNNDTLVESSTTNKQTKAVVNLTSEQISLLSRVVEGEARGESYEGQVAVAAVVLNRIKDSRFPNTIEEVVYQKNAFSIVQDGAINNEPTTSSKKAAIEALYGQDPTNQAIYFWNPDIATCNWIKTLNPHMRIGNHVFAR